MKTFLSVLGGGIGSYLATIAFAGIAFLLTDNVYVLDFVLYFSTLILVVVIAKKLFRDGKKTLSIGVLAGFSVYYLLFWIIHIYGLGESLCTKYFFNLLTNC